MKDLVSLIWWPHSGGRWLSRTILKKNPSVFETAFVHPWIFNSTDDVLSLDITAQIHKARSIPEYKDHLKALSLSTDLGRIEGLRNYYQYILDYYHLDDNVKVILGETCMGSPNPKPVDLHAIFQAFSSMKIIHLVRNPIDSFNSFKSRNEMDGDPIKIAGSWNTLNSLISNFFENTEDLKMKNKYLMVRYEDLLSNTEKEVKKICEFCNIDYHNEMVEGLDERWGKQTKIEHDPKSIEIFKALAYVELKKYGYL